MVGRKEETPGMNGFGGTTPESVQCRKYEAHAILGADTGENVVEAG